MANEGGDTVVAEFTVVAFPGLAVKAVQRLGCTYPELFGAAFVEDCRDGVLHDQVPGHLDFDHVLFVVGRLDVVEFLYLTNVFVEAMLGTHVDLDRVTDLGVALQRDGVVVDPLFAVKLLDSIGGTSPELALAEESVLGTRRHARKEGGVLGFDGVAHAPFVGQGTEGETGGVVVHGRRVVGKGGTCFAHTQLACTDGHFERDDGGACCKGQRGR